MTEKNPERRSLFYPEVLRFLVEREAEGDLIATERKAELFKISEYVTTKRRSGDSVQLTFICTHNSRRSHLSQVWAQVAADYFGLSAIQTFSGGTEATAMNPRAVTALRAAGLQIDADADDEQSGNPRYSVRVSAVLPPQECFSKVFNAAPNPAENYCAVMTCSHADENCPVAMGCDLRVAVRYEDPKEADGTPMEADRYQERSRQICREMLWLMNHVTP
jgi:arsenate reductase